MTDLPQDVMASEILPGCDLATVYRLWKTSKFLKRTIGDPALDNRNWPLSTTAAPSSLYSASDIMMSTHISRGDPGGIVRVLEFCYGSSNPNR
jgi:hypothetical protein